MEISNLASVEMDRDDRTSVVTREPLLNRGGKWKAGGRLPPSVGSGVKLRPAVQSSLLDHELVFEGPIE